MTKAVLRELGLSDNEAEVYLLLLRLQSALASQIAEKCAISRPHIYDTLNKLIEKGLASYVIKDNRKYFKAASPKRLIESLYDRQKNLEAVLPGLLKLYQPKAPKPAVEVFEGREGMKTVLREILREAKHLDCSGAELRIADYLPIEAEKFAKERAKKKITARFLSSSRIKPGKLDEFRLLPLTSSSPVTTLIWNEKAAIWIWGESPLVVVLKSKQVSDGFRSQFNLLWEQKVNTAFGKEGFVLVLDDMIKTGETLYGFGGLRSIWAELYPKEYKQFHQEKIRKKIWTKFIIGKKQFNAKLYKVPYTKVKTVAQRFVRPSSMWVYGNKVGIWIPTDPPIFTTIENKGLADSYRAQFDLIWRRG